MHWCWSWKKHIPVYAPSNYMLTPSFPFRKNAGVSMLCEFLIPKRPDLLAIKSESDGYVIEIKSKSTSVSVDRFREIAEIVAQHDGWHFLLVTGDDISLNEPEQKSEKLLLSWKQILTRREKGESLLLLGELEGAFLAFWGI